MKVILLEDLRGIGKKFEVKEIKDGYVRNFLLPKKAVQIATEEALLKLTSQKKQAELKKNELIKKLEENSINIHKEKFIFKRKTDKNGELFGSVSEKDLEKAIAEKGFGKVKANLDKPIKLLGRYALEADLGEGVRAKVDLEVQKES